MKKLYVILGILAVGVFAWTTQLSRPVEVQPLPLPIHIEKSVEPLAGINKPAGLSTYNLSGAGISSSQTTLTLSIFTLPQNDYPIQDSDLSDTFHMTVEPGSTDRQEFVSCTTVGTNTGGSVTISGCIRGLSPITPYTASTTLQFAHPGGSKVIFSDSPQFLAEELVFRHSSTTVDGFVRFASSTSPFVMALGDPQSDTYAKYIAACTGTKQSCTESLTATPYFGYNATSSKWVFSNNGTNYFDFTSGTSGLTAEASIVIQGSVIKLATTSAPGLEYNAGLRVGEGYGIERDGNLVRVATTSATTWNFKSDNLQVMGTSLTGMASTSFQGIGGNGALSVSANTTTTLNALGYITSSGSGRRYAVWSYSSISIPNTAGLEFQNASNTVVILRSQGNCTIGGFIEINGQGTPGGAGGVGVSGAGLHGVAGATTTDYFADSTLGLQGLGGRGGGGADGEGGRASTTISAADGYLNQFVGRFILPGAGGGGGGGAGQTNVDGGAGGAGGGTIIIQCGGALTFTGSISAKGDAGVIGDNGTTEVGGEGAGGGGGGSGGMVWILANSISSNTGAVTVTAGSGGASGPGTAAAQKAGGGGGGGSMFVIGTLGSPGVDPNGGAGGAGAVGTSTVQLNIVFP